MPSPFPGMDPFLEGYLWPDVHHSLATQIRDQLAPAIRPRYVARIEIQVVVDESPAGEIGIMYPDVEIMQRNPNRPTELVMSQPVFEGLVATPLSATIPLPEVEIRLSTVEVYDTAQNQLVTSIEILSPVNKREPGLSKYRAKQRQLRDANVNILEIDLLRRGLSIYEHPDIPDSLYQVSLIRAGSRMVNVWAIQLADPLPVVSVPLRQPDGDVNLDLGAALNAIYDKAAYDLSINYMESPPPPTLTDEEIAWMRVQIS